MVFVQKSDRPSEGFPVGPTLGLKEVTGTVGLELEVEGKRLPHSVPTGWLYKEDHSLRGEENGEYIFARPVGWDTADQLINKLWDAFAASKTKFDQSNRTSVHVHINVQSFFLNRLTALMSLYFTFEEILTQWCGEHRVGNLFCLRAKDAPAIISQIRRFVQGDMRSPLRDNLHYSGLNAHALTKFGSLEFRSLRGVDDPSIIKQWLRILHRLYDVSDAFKDPRSICEMFSGDGPLEFYDYILGAEGAGIRTEIGWSPNDIRSSLTVGIRMAQDLCYCRDWERYRGVEIRPDPFGRDKSRIVKKMMKAVHKANTIPAPPPQIEGDEVQFMEDPEWNG